MNLKRILCTVLALVGMGCSTDDNGVTQEDIKKTAKADFMVIGEDLDTVYQFNYDADSNNGEQIDLTDELGVWPNYITLRQFKDQLSFFSFFAGAFSLAVKDVSTGALANYDSFYTYSTERSVAWGTNNTSNVFFGYFGPWSSRNLAIQDISLQENEGEDITIDFGIDQVFQPLFLEDKIYMVYRDNQGDYKLTQYNTRTKNKGATLDFGETAISILTNESGNLVVIRNGVETTLEIYDADSLMFLGGVPMSLDSGFLPGPIDDAIVVDNRFYYSMPYAQPAPFSAGPAIYDLTTQENRRIDFLAIANEIEIELGTGITVIAQDYDWIQEVFLVGYRVRTEEVLGGVMQISTDGELLANITVPFFPTYFVKN
ncbi:hypothetical protein [Allomuricauda sp. SCSIO 65647]|uniref:hypothetical protein n=1 Tax=Allomuricauda sp. SCSIO 65647 TaxID=2908843 RepID=UPI001F2BBACB|nr:hypothetical protein [Muricauda sp. SCSIO 65647]UJH68950.1 hypothetical protein L0P89_06970 [Muricauda sp. SCSIO 65647]